MLIRSLFNKYQKYLLAFANTWYGRGYLELQKWAKIKNNYKIVKVSPDGIHFFTGEYTKKGLPIYQAVFFSKSPYLKKFRLALEGLEIAGELIDKIYNYEIVIPHFQGLIAPRAWLPLIMRATDTFYPDVDPESTSVDGRLETEGNSTWADARGAATATEVQDSDVELPLTQGEYVADPYFYVISRCPFLFDTSSIGGENNVTDAEISFYSTTTGDTTEATYPADLSLVSCNPASNTGLVAADFDIAKWGSTRFATDYSISTLAATSEYHTLTLNADGKNAISLTGITKLGIRPANDVDNNAPSARSYWKGYFADNGSNKPKLVITYTLSLRGAPVFL